MRDSFQVHQGNLPHAPHICLDVLIDMEPLKFICNEDGSGKENRQCRTQRNEDESLKFPVVFFQFRNSLLFFGLVESRSPSGFFQWCRTS